MINRLTKNQSPEMEQLKEEYQALQDKGDLRKYESLFDYINYKFRVYFNKLSIGIYANPLIMFVKMADQLHNFTTMYHCSPTKIHRKIQEVELHYLPMYSRNTHLLSPLYEEKYWLMREELTDEIEKLKQFLENSSPEKD